MSFITGIDRYIWILRAETALGTGKKLEKAASPDAAENSRRETLPWVHLATRRK
jgi:hypothetical protein